MDSTNARFDRLDAYIAEGRILRRKWRDTDPDGRERACLLLALAPEVGDGNIGACPADLLPPWLAHFTPDIDDYVSDDAWPDIIREYARVVRRGVTTLDAAGWRRVQARFMLAVLDEVRRHDTAGAVEPVAALWRRVLAGEEPDKTEWRAAQAAAAAAAEAAEAAWAAARAAAQAAAAQAAAARAAAAAAAEAAEAAWAAAAEAETWDRLARALFTAIETECGVARG